MYHVILYFMPITPLQISVRVSDCHPEMVQRTSGEKDVQTASESKILAKGKVKN